MNSSTAIDLRRPPLGGWVSRALFRIVPVSSDVDIGLSGYRHPGSPHNVAEEVEKEHGMCVGDEPHDLGLAPAIRLATRIDSASFPCPG